MVVLGDAPVAHLVEAEDALHDAEDMLYLGPHARLTLFFFLCNSSTSALNFVNLQVISWACGAVSRIGFGLALIAAVAPYLAFLAMQHIGQQMHVRHVSRAGRNRVNVALFRINPDVRLEPEIPLVALPGLVHLRVA